MKIIVAASLLLLSLSISAQVDTVISYSGVIFVDSASQEDLFLRGRQWFAEVFKDSKEVLQINDRETGELSGKGIATIIAEYKYMGARKERFDAHFLLNIRAKDGRYKYEFKNITLEYPGKSEFGLGLLTSSTICPRKWAMVSQKKMDEIYAGAKVGTEQEITELISSLKIAMKSKSDNDF